MIIYTVLLSMLSSSIVPYNNDCILVGQAFGCLYCNFVRSTAMLLTDIIGATDEDWKQRKSRRIDAPHDSIQLMDLEKSFLLCFDLDTQVSPCCMAYHDVHVISRFSSSERPTEKSPQPKYCISFLYATFILYKFHLQRYCTRQVDKVGRFPSNSKIDDKVLLLIMMKEFRFSHDEFSYRILRFNRGKI